MPRLKLECVHVDTCLPDYWGGHHLAHISVQVDKTTTLVLLKNLLLIELGLEAVGGNNYIAKCLSPGGSGDTEYDSRVYKAAKAAVRRMQLHADGQTRLFPNIEVAKDGEDQVQAYFVIKVPT